MEQVVRYAANELAPKKITANCISAGVIRTWDIPAAAESAMRAVTPVGRIGEVDDIVRAIVFLVSPKVRASAPGRQRRASHGGPSRAQADFITGANIPVCPPRQVALSRAPTHARARRSEAA